MPSGPKLKPVSTFLLSAPVSKAGKSVALKITLFHYLAPEKNLCSREEKVLHSKFLIVI